MRRTATWLSVIAVWLVLAVGLPTRVAAQEATPGATAGAGVPIIGPEGTEVARVTVAGIVDPFQDYDPGAPPQRGFHFVLVSVTIANSGDRPFDFDGNAFRLVDTDGFVFFPGGVYRPPDAAAATPDLSYGTLEPGQSTSGVLGYQMLNGTQVASMVYAPGNDRLITVATVGQPTLPEPGMPVSVIGTEGGEVAQITIGELIDPFREYERNAPPTRGYRFVLVGVTIANTGARPLPVDPNAIQLVDTQGYVYFPGGVYRSAEAATAQPDLQYGEVAPGTEATGVLGYEVLNGVGLQQIVYRPANERLITIADLGGAAVPSGTEPSARPTAEPIATTQPTEPAVADTPLASTDDIDCAAVQTWFNETQPRLQRDDEIFTTVGPLEDFPTLDSTVLRQAAAELGALAEAQAGTTVPAGLETVNQVLAEWVGLHAQALSGLADAKDAADLDAANAALGLLTQADDLLGQLSADLDRISTACPEVQ